MILGLLLDDAAFNHISLLEYLYIALLITDQLLDIVKHCIIVPVNASMNGNAKWL